MPSKQTWISGARIDPSVIGRLGEVLRPYMLTGLESLLQEMVQQRLAQFPPRDKQPSPQEVDLRDVVQAGGRWELEGVRVTDLRGIETSMGTVPSTDLSFAEDARRLHFTIKPTRSSRSGGPTLGVSFSMDSTSIEVFADSGILGEVFDKVYDEVKATVPPPPPVDHVVVEPPPFRIFVAYGGGRAWEVVRDYLRGAGFEVDAFTEEERAGQLTLDVVEEMIRSASVAVIVMTGADRMESGAVHARQNVVHEAGFAQGAIGRRNTIILREAGVTLPTNVDGLTYIQFEMGEIHTTRERVVSLVSRLQTQARPGFRY